MKFSRKITAENKEVKVNIDLKMTTDGKLFTKTESVREFDYQYDNMMEALMKVFHVRNIKVK